LSEVYLYKPSHAPRNPKQATSTMSPYSRKMLDKIHDKIIELNETHTKSLMELQDDLEAVNTENDSKLNYFIERMSDIRKSQEEMKDCLTELEENGQEFFDPWKEFQDGLFAITNHLDALDYDFSKEVTDLRQRLDRITTTQEDNLERLSIILENNGEAGKFQEGMMKTLCNLDSWDGSLELLGNQMGRLEQAFHENREAITRKLTLLESCSKDLSTIQLTSQSTIMSEITTLDEKITNRLSALEEKITALGMQREWHMQKDSQILITLSELDKNISAKLDGLEERLQAVICPHEETRAFVTTLDGKIIVHSSRLDPEIYQHGKSLASPMNDSQLLDTLLSMLQGQQILSKVDSGSEPKTIVGGSNGSDGSISGKLFELVRLVARRRFKFTVTLLGVSLAIFALVVFLKAEG